MISLSLLLSNPTTELFDTSLFIPIKLIGVLSSVIELEKKISLVEDYNPTSLDNLMVALFGLDICSMFNNELALSPKR